MTNQLQKLYDFIASRETTTVKDICDMFPEDYKLNAKESNFSNCPKLYKDIDTINEDTTVEKIIVKKNNDFHLATRKEAEDYRNKLFILGKRYMAKYGNIVRKMIKNGEANILEMKNDELSYFLTFTRTYVEEKENA